MQDLFGNAPPSQLLVLMAIPLTGVLIFVAILIFSFTKRAKKKDYMNNRKVPSKTEKAVLPKPLELNTNILLDRQENTAGLDMSILSSSSVDTVKKETETMDLSKKGNIDLGTGLSGLQSPTPTPATLPLEPVELMRLLRHPQTGQLIVEVDGQRYNKLSEITDRKIGQYILELAAHLLTFTNGVIAKSNGIKSVYNPKVGETPQPITTPTKNAPVSSGLVPPPSPEVEATFRASLEAQQNIQKPLPPSSGGLFGFSKPAPAAPTMPGLNLAEEINDIVQLRLMNSHLASTTIIKITTAAGGGINIKVNYNNYASPDDVPDPDIKSLIKNAIKTWERS